MEAPQSPSSPVRALKRSASSAKYSGSIPTEMEALIRFRAMMDGRPSVQPNLEECRALLLEAAGACTVCCCPVLGQLTSLASRMTAGRRCLLVSQPC